MTRTIRYITLLALLLAPCSLLLAQYIVPHRDIQSVDSLNRGKPTTAPATIHKAGYGIFSRDDGRWYEEQVIPYLLDSLELDTLIGAAGGIFYDLGTTDTAVPTDDSVETPVKYTLLNGLSGGLPANIEFLKEGILQFDHLNEVSGSTKAYLRVKPLQQSEGNVDWVESMLTAENYGARYNDVHSEGWNILGGNVENAGEHGFGHVTEGWFQENATYLRFEDHTMFYGTDGIQHRNESLVITDGHPQDWYKYFKVGDVFILDPRNNYKSHEFRIDGADTTASIISMWSPNSANTKGVQFGWATSNNRLTISPIGTSNSTFDVSSFPFSRHALIQRTAVASAYGLTMATIAGNTSDGYFGNIYPLFGLTLTSDTLRADTTKLTSTFANSKAFYKVGTSLPPTAISDHIYKSSGSVAIGQSSAAAQTLHVQGTARITGSSGAASTLMGRDGDGDICAVGPGEGFIIVDNELQFSGGGSDSVYTTDTTLCVIEMGDTTCVLRDSTYFVGDSLLCYIYAGDTTCIDHHPQGVTLYTGDGHITDPARFVDMDPATDVYFRHYEYGGGFAYNLNFYPDGNSKFTEIRQNSVSQTAKTLSLRNDGGGNILQHFDGDGTGENYTMGVDKVANRFSIAKGLDIGAVVGVPFIDIYGVGDSIVMQQDVQLDALLLDEDGDAPTPGDVLTGTATGVDWAAPSGGGGAISDLTVATAANDIDNDAYQQDWRWDLLGAGSGLKLTANTTAASGGTQKLFDVRLSGANANSGQTTIAGYFSNLHTHGTNCTNYAVWGETSTTTSNAVGVYGKGSTGVYGDGGTTGIGVKGVTTSIIGVDASATDGIATQTTATTGIGLEVGVTTGLPMDVYDVTAATNTVERMVIYTHATSGTAAAGLGQSHDYYIEASDGDTYLANSIISQWTTATAGSRTSQFIISGVNSTTTQDLATLAGSGQLTLNQYTTSNFNGGSASDSVLVVTSAGVVKKRDAADFGGSSSPPAPSSIYPSQITSDQDNYAPTGIGKATYVYLSGDNGIRAITGVIDSVAGTLRKTLFNIGSYPFYMVPGHPDSDAAHRFLSPASGDFILYPGQSVDIVYDLTNTGWRIIGNSDISLAKGVNYEYDAASVTFGELWNLGISAAGSSGTITATNATSTHSAHSLLSTSTSTTGAYVMYVPKASSLFSYFGSAHIATESLVSIPVLSDGTQTFAFELKLSATPAGGSLEENNMFGIRYSHSINSGEWELFSQSNTGTETVADLNVAVTADVLYKLRIEVDKSNTEARAYINDAYVGRVTATMPSGTAISASVMLLKSAGSTARTVRVHNISASAIYP